MNCESCGKEFFEDWRKDKYHTKNYPLRFCSRSCSNKRIQSDEMNFKRALTLKKGYEEDRYKIKKIKKICKICGSRMSKSAENLCKECFDKNRPQAYGINAKNFNKYTDTRSKKIRRKLTDLKGGKCQVCGYNKCFSALDFHHKNKNEKKFLISGNGLEKSKFKLIEEANKCILVCSNCHREIHQNLINIKNIEIIKIKENALVV